MTPSRKPLALFLTILLALSTIALSSSTNAEETSARVTNNEEIVVSMNEIYYDRGEDITFTVTSTNLDTEYNIDWVVCKFTLKWVQCTNAHGVSGAFGTQWVQAIDTPCQQSPSRTPHIHYDDEEETGGIRTTVLQLN